MSQGVESSNLARGSLPLSPGPARPKAATPRSTTRLQGSSVVGIGWSYQRGRISQASATRAVSQSLGYCERVTLAPLLMKKNTKHFSRARTVLSSALVLNRAREHTSWKSVCRSLCRRVNFSEGKHRTSSLPRNGTATTTFRPGNLDPFSPKLLWVP